MKPKKKLTPEQLSRLRRKAGKKSRLQLEQILPFFFSYKSISTERKYAPRENDLKFN